MIRQIALKSFFLALLISVFTGCSTTPKLSYQPALPAKQMNTNIQITSFEDQRTQSEPGILGGIYNEYGMRIGEIKEPAELLNTIKQALVTELNNSGYRVNTEKNTALTIDAKLLSLACAIKPNKSVQIKIKFEVKESGKTIYENTYEGADSGGLYMTYSMSGFLRHATQDALGKFVSDLNRYIEGKEKPKSSL